MNKLAKVKYAEVAWNHSDVTCDWDISSEEANEFLARNSKYIVEACVAAGYAAIDECAQMDGLTRRPEEDNG